jgi:signal transduction histidine kinase
VRIPAGLSVKPRALAVALLITSLSTFIVGLVIVDRVGDTAIANHQRRVAETARDVFVAFAHTQGLAQLAQSIELEEQTRDEGKAFQYAVFDNEGNRLAGPDLIPSGQLPAPGFSVRTIDTGGQEQSYELLVQPISSGGTLVIYEDLSVRSAFQRGILIAVAAALLVGIFILSAMSFLFGRLLLHRATGIATAAQRIAGGDLSARAPVGPAGDVFDALAGSVNGMLARIDELLTGLRTVTDSLAHDLRSPLTRLKTDLARALEPSLPDQERLSLIEEAQAEAEQVLATFGALLDIARAESGLSREMMEPVAVTALVSTVGELFGPVFEDGGQQFDVHVQLKNPLVLHGHELILRQALGNLLHNAARYAGPGAHVELLLERDETRVRFTVADNGPGVPAAQRGRVQERFVRGDDSRGTPGSGLGLAIAAACAKLHGGQLLLTDNSPGLRATMEIPLTQASS